MPQCASLHLYISRYFIR